MVHVSHEYKVDCELFLGCNKWCGEEVKKVMPVPGFEHKIITAPFKHSGKRIQARFSKFDTEALFMARQTAVSEKSTHLDASIEIRVSGSNMGGVLYKMTAGPF